MPTIVQKNGGYNGDAASYWSGSYASNVASGNLLIAAVSISDNNESVSGTDSQGNVWTVDALVTGSNPGQSAALLHAIAQGGAERVTIATGQGTQPISVELFEVNGLGTNPTVAVGSGAAWPASTVSGNTNNVSFTSGEFLVADISVYNPNAGAFSAGTGFDSANESGPNAGLNYAMFTASGITSPTIFPFSIGATIGNYAEAAAAYNAGAAVSTPFFESGPKRQYRRGNQRTM